MIRVKETISKTLNHQITVLNGLQFYIGLLLAHWILK